MKSTITTREGGDTRRWRVAEADCEPTLGALVAVLEAMQAEGMPDSARVVFKGHTYLRVEAKWTHVETLPNLT